MRLTLEELDTPMKSSDVVYTWSLEPSTAGSITGDGRRAIVEWDNGYQGQASISYSYENSCGSTAVSEPILVRVFNSTGIGEQEIATIDVYPNPAKDMIHIRTNQDGEVALRIIDMTGKVVYECGPSTGSGTAGMGTATIATSKFGGSGIYTLQVIQNDNVKNVRLVVMP